MSATSERRRKLGIASSVPFVKLLNHYCSKIRCFQNTFPPTSYYIFLPKWKVNETFINHEAKWNCKPFSILNFVVLLGGRSHWVMNFDFHQKHCDRSGDGGNVWLFIADCETEGEFAPLEEVKGWKMRIRLKKKNNPANLLTPQWTPLMSLIAIWCLCSGPAKTELHVARPQPLFVPTQCFFLWPSPSHAHGHALP